MSLDAIVMRDEDIVAAELADFRREGGSAVVGMSTPGPRVDPLATRLVSEKSGVHIVGTAGLDSRDSWPQRFHDRGLDKMEAYMMQEVEGGIEGTDVKPGRVKVAIEEDFCGSEVKALRAGACVAGRTGLLNASARRRSTCPQVGSRRRSFGDGCDSG